MAFCKPSRRRNLPGTVANVLITRADLAMSSCTSIGCESGVAEVVGLTVGDGDARTEPSVLGGHRASQW